MRELKFRVYDKEEKCYSDKAFSIDQLGICYVQDEDGYWEEIDEERYVIEQSTGLKDKNGKEIYEGDIVKYISFNDKEYIGQVVFGFVADSEGYYVAKHYGWGIRREDFNRSLGDYADDDMECEYVEVIGNIHENPELLENTK